MPRSRQRLLAALFMQRGKWQYLSELAKQLHVQPSSIQTDLTRLAEAGILERQTDAGRVYFRPDMRCPIYAELRSIVMKCAGFVEVLGEVLHSLQPEIRLGFVFGSVVRGEEVSSSDVDILVVGDHSPIALAKALGKAEEQLGRPVNASSYTAEEMFERQHTRFLRHVLSGEKWFVIGDERQLAELVGVSKEPTAQHHPGGSP